MESSLKLKIGNIILNFKN